MSTQIILSLSVFVLVLIGFLTQKLPMALVAIGGMVLMVATGCLEPVKALAQFGTANVVLIGSLFVVSGAFTKTRYINNIAAWIAAKCKGSLTMILAGYAILLVFLGQFVSSASGRFAMVIPLAIASCKALKVSPSRIVYPLAVIAMSTSGLIPTTSAISMCETYRPMFTAAGMEAFADYSVMDYCLSRIALAVVVLPVCIFYLPKHLPDRIPVESLAQADAAGTDAFAKEATLKPWQEKVCLAMFLLTCVGLVFVNQINKVLVMPNWLIALTAALVVVAIGALRGKELYNNMGISVLLLTIGSAAIAGGLTASGAADVIGDLMSGLFGAHPNGYPFGGAIFLISCLVAQFITGVPMGMSFVPIILIACKSFGANPVGPVFLCLSGALAGFVAPTANAVASMMYPMGNYEFADLAKRGIPLAILCGIVQTAIVMTLFPFYA